ncbi:MAG: ATP-binding protein [Lysobacterales bacterium]
MTAETRRSVGSLKTQNQVLLDLAMSLRHPDPDFSQALQEITEATARYLAVQRASIWFFNAGRSELTCMDLLESDQHTVAAALLAIDYPDYFKACKESRVIDADHAATDPRTHEFAAEYLAPLGIGAMLDGPIFSGDTVRGVVCAEHVGRPREWTEDEKAFVSSVADLAALALVTRERTDALNHIESLLEIAPVGVLVVDQEATVVRVNARSKTLFDCDGQWLIGRDLAEIVPAAMHSERGVVSRGLKGDFGPPGAAEEHLLQGRGRNGKTFPVSLSMSEISDSGKRFLVVLVNDVSERVQMESQLRQSEAKYRAVVEDHTGFILRTNASGRVEFANQAFWNFVDVNPETDGYPLITDFLASGELEIVQRAISRITQDNPAETYENKLTRPDGREASVCWTLRGFHSAEGELMGYQAIGQDVTLARAQELRLREAERLESLAVLSGGIAHDFNNLLTPILAYTDMMLAETQPDSEHLEPLRSVMSAAERATGLVSQLLVFSRRDRSEDREPLLASPYIRETLEFVRASAPANIEIDSQIDTYCGVLHANPSDIFQILSNLCANAIQAMPAGGRLMVNASEIQRDGAEWLQLIVKDNGPGVKEADQPFVFDPFWTTKPKGKGTGLGLSVVQGLVQELGGMVDLASEIGKGAAFVVLLPNQNVAVEEQVNVEPGRVFTGTESVLVVDDDPAIAGLVGEGLEKLGYSVTMRNSANEALAAVQADPEAFDVLLTDFTMPYMSGIDLGWHCRRVNPEMPVVVMSGFGQLITQEELSRGLVDGCIQKPFRIDQVAHSLREVLDRPANLADEEKD